MNFRGLFRFKIRLYSTKSKRTQTQRQTAVKSKSAITLYDSLGIASTSTQNEIKSAYYKMSMLHHPDKNQDNPDSAEKFRKATEAYEVLGNVKSRKLYDKGLFIKTSPTFGSTTTAYPRSEIRRPGTGFSGATPIYDFDQWSKSHYGATFKRQAENKRRSQEYNNERMQDQEFVKKEKALLFILGLMVFGMMMMRNERSYDIDKIYSKKS